jgi:acylpyruvate hydrolase
LTMRLCLIRYGVPRREYVHHANQVDGKPRQRGSTKDMLFNVPTLIAFISSIVALQDGDLILCGTPPGVGAVQAGQTMQAGMETGAGAALGASACRRRAIA